jgi:hypothetical protein
MELWGSVYSIIGKVDLAMDIGEIDIAPTKETKSFSFTVDVKYIPFVFCKTVFVGKKEKIVMRCRTCIKIHSALLCTVNFVNRFTVLLVF